MIILLSLQQRNLQKQQPLLSNPIHNLTTKPPTQNQLLTLHNMQNRINSTSTQSNRKPLPNKLNNIITTKRTRPKMIQNHNLQKSLNPTHNKRPTNLLRTRAQTQK